MRAMALVAPVDLVAIGCPLVERPHPKVCGHVFSIVIGCLVDVAVEVVSADRCGSRHRPSRKETRTDRP